MDAYDIIEDILLNIVNKGEYYFSVYVNGDTYGYVTYSRNFSGGAFQGAFRYKLLSNGNFLLDAINKPSRMIRKEFDLKDPNSFNEMENEVQDLIDTMQTKRILNKTPGFINVYDKHGKYTHRSEAWKKNQIS